MIYLGNSPVGVAVAPMGWTCEIITAPADYTTADQVKAWIASLLGTRKAAMLIKNRDWSSLPITNQEFVSAVFYDGFNTNTWTRFNVSSSSTTIGAYHSQNGANYWTNTYNARVSEGDEFAFVYQD